MADEDNIYAPPDAELDSGAASDGVLAFKRISAFMVFLLTFITAGIYGAYWLATRSKVLNTIQERPISGIVINGFLVSYIVSIVFSILLELQPDNVSYLSLNALLTLAYVVFYVILAFTFRSRLRDVTRDMPNGILVFFFSAIYLQYKINVAVEARKQ